MSDYPAVLPPENNVAECRVTGDGVSIAPFRFQYTNPRGVEPGQGTFECELRHLGGLGRDFRLPSLPQDVDELGLDGETRQPAAPDVLINRRLTATLAIGGQQVIIGPLFATHIAPVEMTRPTSSTTAVVSVYDRRVLWGRFGAVTLRANVVIAKTEDALTYDPASTIDGTNPWKLPDVLSLLFTKMNEDNGQWSWNAATNAREFQRGSLIAFPASILAADFPAVGEIDWEAGESPLGRLRELLDRYQLDVAVSGDDGAIEIVEIGVGELPDVPDYLVIANTVEYQNERIARPHRYAVVGERVAITRHYANMVPVLQAKGGEVVPLNSDANAQKFGVDTLAQLKKGAFLGGKTFLGEEWSFVKDSSGKVATTAGADLGEIAERKERLKMAYRLWRIPSSNPSEANASALPILDVTAPVDVGIADLARPDAPRIFGPRPVKRGGFLGGGWVMTGANDEYQGGVRVADARLGILETDDMLGTFDLPSTAAPALSSDVEADVDAAASGIRARISYLKNDGRSTTGLSSLIIAGNESMELTDGDPLLDWTFFALTDNATKDLYPGEPKRTRFVRVPGFQLLITLDADADIESDNRLAVRAVGFDIIKSVAERLNIFQSVTRVYGVPLPLSPNGIVDSVTWSMAEPGGEGASTTVTAGDLTRARAPKKPVRSLGREIKEGAAGAATLAQIAALRARVKSEGFGGEM